MSKPKNRYTSYIDMVFRDNEGKLVIGQFSISYVKSSSTKAYPDIFQDPPEIHQGQMH